MVLVCIIYTICSSIRNGAASRCSLHKLSRRWSYRYGNATKILDSRSQDPELIHSRLKDNNPFTSNSACDCVKRKMQHTSTLSLVPFSSGIPFLINVAPSTLLHQPFHYTPSATAQNIRTKDCFSWGIAAKTQLCFWSIQRGSAFNTLAFDLSSAVAGER